MIDQNDSRNNVDGYAPLARVKLLIDDLDNDETGAERKIPAGTLGTITRVEYSITTGFHYHVEFDNGGWLIFYADQLASHLRPI